MAKINLSKECKQEITEITEQLKRKGINIGVDVEVYWAEPGMMYSFRCSKGNYYKSIKTSGEWLITKA